MSESVNEKGKKTVRWIDVDKRVKWIVGLGVAGILIILLSEFVNFAPSSANQPPASNDENAEYVSRLESRLSEIISGIEGVGEAKVMITLETGAQNVYAQEEKRNTDRTQDFDGEDTKKLQTKDNTEQKYILVDGLDGAKTALVLHTIEPTVKGVVIICEGADNPVVEHRVVSAVTTALGIPSNKVCVTKSSVR